MTLKNKKEVVDELSVNDCPILKKQDNFTVRSIPALQFAVLFDVPNYIVVNEDTDKIEFTSDVLQMCDHFLGFSAGGGLPMAGQQNEPSPPTLN